ncbi:hypothetical protein ACJZ2D_012737 [Fusarium nematophilum]
MATPITMPQEENLPTLDDVLEDLNMQNHPSAVDTGWVVMDNESADNESLSPEEEGETCAIKNVYEGPSVCECCINWMDELPEDDGPRLEAADETADSKRHAILVRNKRTKSGAQATEVYQIVVQSSVLKGFLQETLGIYPELVFEAKQMVFTTPFEPLFHHWDQIQQAARRRVDETTVPLVRLLIRTLRREIKPALKAQKALVDFSIMTFPLSWTLFKPGDLVLRPKKRGIRMYRLESTSFDPKTGLDLECAYVDWDGSRFGYDTASFKISHFNGKANF